VATASGGCSMAIKRECQKAHELRQATRAASGDGKKREALSCRRRPQGGYESPVAESVDLVRTALTDLNRPQTTLAGSWQTDAFNRRLPARTTREADTFA
jgi:hypothetical protein